MLRLYKDEKKKTPCCHPGGRSTVFENMDSDSNNRTELDGAAKENTLSGKNIARSRGKRKGLRL